jgi:hypothetical protein
MQHTPWFSVKTPPVRPGVYNISCRDHDQTGTWFAYFDGEYWRPWKQAYRPDYSFEEVANQEAIEKAFDARFSCTKWKDGSNFYENWTWRGIIKE